MHIYVNMYIFTSIYGYMTVCIYAHAYICTFIYIYSMIHTCIMHIYIHMCIYIYIGWLRLVGSLKLQVSFAKEPYKRDYILQQRPIILRSLLIVAIPY